MKFNAKQLDGATLRSRAEAEALLINSSASSSRGRSYEKILETTIYGHAAELYLIQEESHTDDPREYKDVFDPDGNPVEVKVTGHPGNVPSVLARANEKKLHGRFRQNFPNILYVFIGNKITCDYHLHGIYKWNGIAFIKQQ